MGAAISFDSNDTTTRITRTVVRRYLPAAGRILMGALFLSSGLFGLLAAPQATPGLPEGAIAFTDSLMKTGYMLPLISGTQAVVGALLLVNRFVPLALALLAPVVVNIVVFHLFLEPHGLGLAIVVAALEIYLAGVYRETYRPMLALRPA
jgi:uncharacterized membrane protein YphA (DoxX/SURF4 family)